MPQKISSHAPGAQTRSVKRLCLMSAEFYHGAKQKVHMMTALERLSKPEDRVNWLLRKGYTDLAAPIMKKEGIIVTLLINIFSLQCMQFCILVMANIKSKIYVYVHLKTCQMGFFCLVCGCS